MSKNGWPSSYLDELESQIDLTPDVLRDVRFIDVEASSLFKTSYPIEVAAATVDMQVESMLIRPLPHWGLEDWSFESENVHNISRRMLEQEGQDAKLVALRSNALLRGRYVFSDNPGFDNRWFQRLFADVDVKMEFGAQDYEPLRSPAMKIAVRTMSPEEMGRIERKVEMVYLHTHRAGDDARRMAALIRYLVDPEWRAWFDRADFSDLVREAGRDPDAPRPRRK